MDEGSFGRVVDAVYDAALDAGAWPRALELLSDAFSAGPAALLFQNQENWSGTGATVRLDPSALTAFYRYYGQRNPLTIHNHRFAPEKGLPITTDEEVLPKQSFMSTEYYNDFYAPNGMHSALMITTGAQMPSVATISIMRPRSRPAFESADVELARRLQPHLAAAFQINLRLAFAAGADDALIAMVDRARHGVFVVGEDGRVQRVNPAGMALLGDGITLSRGELVVADGDAAKRLRAHVCRAGGPSHARGSGVMRVPRPSQRSPFIVVVTPIGHKSTELFQVGPAALVTVSDPEAAFPPDASLLSQTFGLTGSEMRLVDRLLNGETPREAAETLGVALTTVRWHLASLYRKTGTRRQAELVRLFMSRDVF